MAMIQATRKRTRLQEVTILDGPRVDREAGVIYGVKILGFESRNGRRYEREAVARAVPLYEGRGVNLDHRRPDERAGDRSVRDHFGELRNVVLKDDGLYGDLHYLKSHVEADTFAERAERMSGQIGMSHDASGKTFREDGVVVVESIDEVISVDLVLYPATTDGLFESEGFNMAEQVAEPKKDDVVKEQDVVATPPPADPEKDSFVEEAGAVLNGEGTLDEIKAALTQIMAPPEIEEAEDGTSPEPVEKDEMEEAEGEEDKPDPEVKESLRRMQRRLDAQDVLLEQRIDRTQLTQAQVSLLNGQASKKAMTTLVESWPPYLRSTRPNLGQPMKPRGKGDYDSMRKELIG